VQNFVGEKSAGIEALADAQQMAARDLQMIEIG
jgi:hypothetical protein